MKNILITGGSGLLGQEITSQLQSKGYEVGYLSRTDRKIEGISTFVWNIHDKSIEADALEWADAIIHLAGAGVMDSRWTPQRKKEIIDSRVESANLIYHSLKEAKQSIECFVSASGIAYYGSETTQTIYREIDQPGSDFLATVTQLWEAAAQQFSKDNIPTSMIRVSVVLSASGGALSKIDTPVKWGIGAALGSGKQYMPWIHIKDVAALFIWALENKKEGVYNGSATEHVDNKGLSKTVAQVLGKPFFMPPVPGFLIKIVLGERADMVLKGSRTSAEKVLSEGFQFQFPKLREALENIYS